MPVNFRKLCFFGSSHNCACCCFLKLQGTVQIVLSRGGQADQRLSSSSLMDFRRDRLLWAMSSPPALLSSSMARAIS